MNRLMREVCKYLGKKRELITAQRAVDFNLAGTNFVEGNRSIGKIITSIACTKDFSIYSPAWYIEIRR